MKIENEYNELYGNISRDSCERFSQLLHSVKISSKNRNSIIDRIHENINIKYKRVNFIIYLLPKATPRPRSNYKNHVFYVSGAKDNKKIFCKFMEKQDIPMIITPCKFTVLSYLPIPKSMNPVEKILAELGLIRPISKPDWDNLGKTYSDMIQDSLIYDDSLIIEGISKKFYSTKPRIEIGIEYMEKFDSEFNEKKMRKKVDL